MATAIGSRKPVGGVTTKYLVHTLNRTGLPQVMDEMVSGAVTRTYAYGVQRISEDQPISSTWTPSFYGYDGHGNVRFLTNNAGTVTDSYDYDAFGMPITSSGTTPNNYLYSGEQYDGALGMYYLRARYYNPATGRFLVMDPDAGSVLDPATLHKYVYTQNDPVDRIDPSGRADIEEEAVLDAKTFTIFRQGFSAWRQRLAAACEDRVDQWVIQNGPAYSRDEILVILAIYAGCEASSFMLN